MRFNAATVAALVAVFAASSVALAGEAQIYRKCNPCRRENACIKGRCTEHRFCPVGHELKGELCCFPIRYNARGGDGYGYDGGKGKGGKDDGYGDHNKGGKDDGNGNDWFSADKSRDLTRSSIGDHNKGGNKGGKDDGNGDHSKGGNKGGKDDGHGDHNKGGNKGGKDDGRGDHNKGGNKGGKDDGHGDHNKGGDKGGKEDGHGEHNKGGKDDGHDKGDHNKGGDKGKDHDHDGKGDHGKYPRGGDHDKGNKGDHKKGGDKGKDHGDHNNGGKDHDHEGKGDHGKDNGHNGKGDHGKGNHNDHDGKGDHGKGNHNDHDGKGDHGKGNHNDHDGKGDHGKGGEKGHGNYPRGGEYGKGKDNDKGWFYFRQTATIIRAVMMGRITVGDHNKGGKDHDHEGKGDHGHEGKGDHDHEGKGDHGKGGKGHDDGSYPRGGDHGKGKGDKGWFSDTIHRADPTPPFYFSGDHNKGDHDGKGNGKDDHKGYFFDRRGWIKNLTLNHQETMETTTKVATIMEKEMAKGSTVTTAETADMAGKWFPKLAARFALVVQSSTLFLDHYLVLIGTFPAVFVVVPIF
ncbi:hypothetical protein B0H13DRAFT_1852908 [Mycena leptocephala]|nr:hypothetical protein B0H13DRAFT_1852908 [Mycena leptocephala]